MTGTALPGSLIATYKHSPVRTKRLSDLAVEQAQAGATEDEIIAALVDDQKCWHPAMPLEEIQAVAHAAFTDNGALAAGADRLTEAAAARRFAEFNGDRLRFDHRRHCWLIWTGHRWMPDRDGAHMRAVLQFARSLQEESLGFVSRYERDRAFKNGIKYEGLTAARNLLTIASNLPPITTTGAGWDVDRWLLGVPNGVVDLRTGNVREGRRSDRMTMQAAVPYDPSAACPRWEQFIAEIFAGDQALMNFVQRAVGYSLSGDTSEQTMFVALGTGSNGKSVFTNTLRPLLGDYATNMPFSTIELKDRAAIPNDVAALVGRRFVAASETNDGTRLNEARIKALTGSDPLTARFLHGEFFTFEPVAKFWLAVNHRPVVRDDSHGFWRRIRLIPFTQRFAQNRTLAHDLWNEAPGILAWAVRGCIAWQEHGLPAPSAVTAATDDYARDSDPLAQFLAEAVDLAPSAEVGASDLFRHYQKWAEVHGLGHSERLTSTMFGRKMAERFERHDGARRTYRGITRRAPL